jgi:hypothetical protein
MFMIEVYVYLLQVSFSFGQPPLVVRHRPQDSANKHRVDFTCVLWLHTTNIEVQIGVLDINCPKEPA